MNVPNREVLSEAERAFVEQTIKSVRAAPRPKDRSPYGCLLAVVGIATLVFFPWVATKLEMEGVLAGVVGGVALLLVVLGIAIHFLAGGFVRGTSIGTAQDAIDELEDWNGDREAGITSATRLLLHATVEYGPTATSAFDPDQVAPRIMPVLPLVKAVEKMLLDGGRCYPVFTELDDEDIPQ